MRKIKFLVLALCILVIAYLTSVFYLGKHYESNQTTRLDEVNQYLQEQNIPVKIKLLDYHYGFFNAKARYGIQDSHDDQSKPNIVIVANIKHGPLIGLTAPAFYRSVYTLERNANTEDWFKYASAEPMVVDVHYPLLTTTPYRVFQVTWAPVHIATLNSSIKDIDFSGFQLDGSLKQNQLRLHSDVDHLFLKGKLDKKPYEFSLDHLFFDIESDINQPVITMLHKSKWRIGQYFIGETNSNHALILKNIQEQQTQNIQESLLAADSQGSIDKILLGGDDLGHMTSSVQLRNFNIAAYQQIINAATMMPLPKTNTAASFVDLFRDPTTFKSQFTWQQDNEQSSLNAYFALNPYQGKLDDFIFQLDLIQQATLKIDLSRTMLLHTIIAFSKAIHQPIPVEEAQQLLEQIPESSKHFFTEDNQHFRLDLTIDGKNIILNGNSYTPETFKEWVEQ